MIKNVKLPKSNQNALTTSAGNVSRTAKGDQNIKETLAEFIY